MAQKSIFVTVGTTQFPKLIETVSSAEIQQTLKQLGYKFVQLQTGTEWKETDIDPSANKDGEGIILKYHSYFENFQAEIEKSSLVISHAGAGSCLDVLRLKKPLIVVVNEDLMENHQLELAKQLQNDGYLYFCTCSTLNETLQKDLTLLKTYPEPQKNLFANYLDKCMGFVQ